MAIKKQEFYEGAALHLLTRTGAIPGIHYVPPFFVLCDRLLVLLKYCTRPRSPWGFTFTPDEQALLQQRAQERPIVIAMVCGSDGVAAFKYESYLTIAAPRPTALRISCVRHYGQHYGDNGPDGVLAAKVAPSDWMRILEARGSG
jgi:hypothetical protein